MRPYTDAEFHTFTHVIWTSDVDWDPCILDHNMEDDDFWFNAVQALERDP